jgi:transposase
MRQIREVLRLKMEGRLSHKDIAAVTRLSKTAVTNCVKRAAEACLGWPLPEEMDDAALERLLYPQAVRPAGYQQPDYGLVHQELQRKGVTLQLLWEEYRETHGERAYGRSQFCAHYQAFSKTLARSMRQTHLAGEKLFVDYSGKLMPVVVDIQTGEVREAEIFVASLGASKYTYAEATWTQSLPDWIESHKRTFKFLGAVPYILTPDCLKSAVKQACRYEPEVNSTYEDMASHYGCVVIPARPYRPKDKAIVESHVQVVQRWILAVLRNRTFFSLHELNQAIAELLVRLNNRPFKKLPGTRASAFREIDLPAMKPLPEQPYEFAEFKGATVNRLDYHVEAGGHYYSCPYQLAGEPVRVRMTAYIVEIFYKGRRVASHARSNVIGKHSTLQEHRPEAHKRYSEWTPGRLLRLGAKIGEGTRRVIEWQLNNRPHPEQGFRSCMGVLRLADTYGEQRLEAACRRALSRGAPTYKRLKGILDANLDQHPDLFTDVPAPPPTSSRSHENVRGAEYFRSATQTEPASPPAADATSTEIPSSTVEMNVSDDSTDD